MSDWHDELRDRLAADAEAYEASSPHGSTVDSNFETDNPGLAKTLRMLQAVFLPSPDLPFEDQAAWETMGRFAIKRRLGTGNFGSVWLAHDPLLKRDVAIKVAHVGIHARPDLQERFEREGHLAARLHHPNIVPVFETGVDQGRMFIVSEYSPGPSLETWLQERAGPIEPRIAAELVRQLADAADHAHRQGLIHRDIKPGNVLLTISGDGAADLPPVPRLTDFGLARDLTSDTSATQNGVMLGTIGYMSPEQASGKLDAQGPASDIFSLGVLLYRLLSGTAPFAGETDFETIQQVIRAEPVPLTRRCANVTRDLNSVCLKCLERMPVARYATAAELNDDLDRYLRGEATVARPISGLEQMTRWAKRAPAVASLVFVVFASLIAISAGLGFYLQVVERHSREMAIALQAAHEERHAADAQRQIARAISYRSDMRLAFDLRERGEIHPVLEILARQQPQDGVDLRGPEWFVLDAEYKAKYRELGRQEGAVTECLLTRDEQTVYSAGTDGVVRVRNLATGKLLRIIRPVMGEIHAMALSPDETTLALGGETWDDDRARVALFDAATGERRGTLQNHATTIESIEFSPDGRWLAAGSRYEPVQLTRLADDASFTLNSDRRNRSVSFSP
ncbi:MAG: protein kinase, partial [Planctomycetales bacterium]|nr:protein kinase [Planctomycetales bacterium]